MAGASPIVARRILKLRSIQITPCDQAGTWLKLVRHRNIHGSPRDLFCRPGQTVDDLSGQYLPLPQHRTGGERNLSPVPGERAHCLSSRLGPDRGVSRYGLSMVVTEA